MPSADENNLPSIEDQSLERRRFNFVNNNDHSMMTFADENTLVSNEDARSGINPNHLINNEKLKKDVIIIDLSDDEVDILYAESRKTNAQLNNNKTNTDSDDEGPAIFKRSTKDPHTSLQKQHKFSFIDEDSDEEERNIQNYIYPDTCYNINENDEARETLIHRPHKFTLLEDIDEEEGNIQNYIYHDTWSNINDNDFNTPKFTCSRTNN
ncbi:hypothetical protein Tco_0898752 [Tanacetum coccineum]